MRTILITGTDNAGPEDWWSDPWIVQPWTDHGRITPPLDRANAISVENQYYEMAVLGQPDSIAFGLRSIHDAGWTHLPLMRETITWADLQGVSPPTVMPFLDTGWFVHAPGGPFDFANSVHLSWFWTDWLGPWFTMFPEHESGVLNPIHWERTSDGRILILVWSNHTGLNPHVCWNALDSLRDRMRAQGLEPAFIVHQNWRSDPRVERQVYGLHGWFDAAQSSWSIVQHSAGLRVGVTVPSFHDWRGSTIQPPRIIDGEHGDLLRRTLARFRDASCDYAVVESYSNIIETAGLYRDVSGSDTYLNVLRDHMALTSGVDPIPPAPTPPTVPGGRPMIAIANAPIFHPTTSITGWLTGELEGHAVKLTKPLLGNDPNDPMGSGGYYLSIQPDGSYQGRPSPGGAYETLTVNGADLVCAYQHAGADIVHVVPFKDL